MALMSFIAWAAMQATLFQTFYKHMRHISKFSETSMITSPDPRKLL